MVVDSDYIVLLNHDLFESLLILSPVMLELVDLTELSDNLEEFISSTCLLWLEERQPEDLSFDALLEFAANISCEVVVDDVLEVDRVKLVSPRVENLETFMVHVLLAEPVDVFLDELEVSLIRLDWIAQVVLVDRLAVVAQEAADSESRRAAAGAHPS